MATLIPFLVHTYDGVVPPNTGTATNVVGTPVQAVSPDAVLMLTEGNTGALTVMDTLLLAVSGVAQAALLVITQDTPSPSAGV